MFEPNMDEYLDEEVEFVKQSFEMTCRSWEKQVGLSFGTMFFFSHVAALRAQGHRWDPH